MTHFQNKNTFQMGQVLIFGASFSPLNLAYFVQYVYVLPQDVTIVSGEKGCLCRPDVLKVKDNPSSLEILSRG